MFVKRRHYEEKCLYWCIYSCNYECDRQKKETQDNSVVYMQGPQFCGQLFLEVVFYYLWRVIKNTATLHTKSILTTQKNRNFLFLCIAAEWYCSFALQCLINFATLCLHHCLMNHVLLNSEFGLYFKQVNTTTNETCYNITLNC